MTSFTLLPFGKSEILQQNIYFQTTAFRFIQRRLDYVFISKNSQEIAKHTEIFKAFTTDYSLVLYSFQNICIRLKKHINKIKGELIRSNPLCDQVKWEVLKYEIHCFPIQFSKDLAKTTKQKQAKIFRVESKL